MKRSFKITQHTLSQSVTLIIWTAPGMLIQTLVKIPEARSEKKLSLENLQRHYSLTTVLANNRYYTKCTGKTMLATFLPSKIIRSKKFLIISIQKLHDKLAMVCCFYYLLQMIRSQEGIIKWKITMGGGVKGQIAEGGSKLLPGVHCPFCPIAIVRPWPC